ncbi:MAG: Tartrate dehydrogenase/decarboxylase [Burkholderia gladioli]|nr:MAG: Tartrate dehydrogenase/decarboxylase [Burkholderia gladioli]
MPSPLANRKPGDIDFMIVRENTEGEYSSVGGTMFEGTEREFVSQQAVFTRTGTERVILPLIYGYGHLSKRHWPARTALG